MFKYQFTNDSRMIGEIQIERQRKDLTGEYMNGEDKHSTKA